MSDILPRADLDGLIGFLKEARGLDLSGYKPTTLSRRISMRVRRVKAASVGDYVDYLQAHPEEYGHLLDAILINITAFFRDPAAWNEVRTVIPAILAAKRDRDPIRVWSAGCSSGEEVYSLAMVLGEQMGLDALARRVKIYATDVDAGDTLAQARQGVYSAKALEPVSDQLRRKYFQRAGARYMFRPELRRSIIFGRHDLLQDAPISHIDLLVCRNTLMYFNAEAQRQVLSRFHFALRDEGVLFLGKAELLLTHGHLFEALDLKSRIFRKISVPRGNGRLAADPGGAAPRGSLSERLSAGAFEATPVAQVVVDAAGTLVGANGAARAMFGLSVADVGRPFRDLELSYRPVELRAVLEQVMIERRPHRIAKAERSRPGRDAQYLDIEVIPVIERGGSELSGACVVFNDVTEAHRLQQEVERATNELETAYEELQSTNEELETTNEELQSTVEELETTNEELQSTNEEQETMNEELHSTNEELEAINEELKARTDQMHRTNGFLEAILNGLDTAVAVVDERMQVVLWSSQAQELWGLRPDETHGRSMVALDFGLPVSELAEPLRSVLDGRSPGEVRTVAAVSRRGKEVACRITVTPVRSVDGEGPHAIVLMHA